MIQTTNQLISVITTQPGAVQKDCLNFTTQPGAVPEPYSTKVPSSNTKLLRIG